jgi:hypothetical protein
MTETTVDATEASKKHEEFDIVVNAAPYTVDSQLVTFEQVVKIAYPTPPSPDSRFTVSFRKAHEPKEGSLLPGGSVEVKKEGTIFNVKATGKS